MRYNSFFRKVRGFQPEEIPFVKEHAREINAEQDFISNGNTLSAEQALRLTSNWSRRSNGNYQYWVC